MTSRNDLMRDVNAFMRSCVLVAVADLDLATVMLSNGNALTGRDIARLSGCDLRGCVALLDAMAALGYFTKQGAGDDALYGVDPSCAEALDSREPETQIPIIRHLGCVQRSWISLARAVREGVPPGREPSILGEEADRVSFIMGMNSVAVKLRQEVMPALAASGILPAREASFRLLDVGGASGTYTEAFLELFPRAEATIFDLPVGIAQAKKRFADHPFGPRVRLAQGDFTVDPLPPGADFAWVSAIIHQFDREETRLLYGKVHDALNPGGVIAVRDYVMDEQGLRPLDGALFGINMFVNTKKGRVYSLPEIREDLESAGFAQVKLAVDAPTMGAVVSAVRAD